MNQRTRLTMGLFLAGALVACSPSEPVGETEAERMEAADAQSTLPAIAEPPAAAAVVSAPVTASGSMVVYACDNGSGVTVTYDKFTALVKLPSGSTTLSRAEGASSPGNDAYLGEELSLYRNGNWREGGEGQSAQDPLPALKPR